MKRQFGIQRIGIFGEWFQREAITKRIGFLRIGCMTGKYVRIGNFILFAIKES